MATDRHLVKTYLNDREKERLDELAAQLRISRSDLLRRLLMGHRLPDPSDFEAWEAIRHLLRVNADLARLGNLFKLALDEELPEHSIRQIEKLTGDIAKIQRTLKASVHDVRDRLKRPVGGA